MLSFSIIEKKINILKKKHFKAQKLSKFIYIRINYFYLPTLESNRSERNKDESQTTKLFLLILKSIKAMNLHLEC